MPQMGHAKQKTFTELADKMLSEPSTMNVDSTLDALADNSIDQSDFSEILSDLDRSALVTGQASEEADVDSDYVVRLAENRLGMVASLFTALRYRDPATAAHSLRVAVSCSRWAAALQMPDKLRTQLEAAALLHDVGKISVADAVLRKPGRLTAEEKDEMHQCVEAAERILTSAGIPSNIVEGVTKFTSWQDGTHHSESSGEEKSPVIARMIAIVDAFDSMTTPQVYRPARSFDQAIAELFEGAGTQFDAELVSSFITTLKGDKGSLDNDVAARWVTSLDLGGKWEQSLKPSISQTKITNGESPSGSPFADALVNNISDGVAYITPQGQITAWNHGAEQLTGIGAEAICGKTFRPDIFRISTAKGSLVSEQDCPVQKAITCSQQVFERYEIRGRNDKYIGINLHAIPVMTANGTLQGVTLFLRDISSVATLEQQCQNLQTATTKDPMTQVANRAEFDRMLEAYIDTHLETGLSCSLVMADIDHFKRVNDDFGHQAGDQIIMAFAQLLKTQCRSGDLVARYGGEEFVILCADCNNATASARAEQLRKQFADISHPELGGKNVTASFGVTELQEGDTPETFLRRTDRGLYIAKDQGRNQVVQLGPGMCEEKTTEANWFSFKDWITGSSNNQSIIERKLVSNVPVELVVEKLKGFIADRNANIRTAKMNHLQVEVIDTPKSSNGRAVTFIVDLKLEQEKVEKTNNLGLAAGKYVQTNIDVSIRPKRDRDRRKGPIAERARLLFSNLRSYLIAKEVNELAE